VWVWIDDTSEGLWYGDDAGSNVLVACGLAHQLLQGLIGETCQIAEKLSVSHEIDSEHLWQGESDEGVPDVFEKLVLEKGGEGGSALCVTGRAETSLFAAQCQQLFRSASVALQSCETGFDGAAVKVAGDDLIDEPSPETEFSLEAVLPECLDVVVVGLEELIEG